ncbi:MAG: hypothetical protein AAGC91_01120 [Pseudomonadota bacterium]
MRDNGEPSSLERSETLRRQELKGAIMELYRQLPERYQRKLYSELEVSLRRSRQATA